MPETEKYDDFRAIPDHVNHKRVHGAYPNRYEPTSRVPTEGEFPHVTNFLEHVFGERIESGLDYPQLVYTRPVRIPPPVLPSVSNERNTGKTTSPRFLKTIFGGNATFNANEDFGSRFNSDRARRPVVLVDELLPDKTEDTEKIENLSTANDCKIEAEGKDRREIEFFAEFALCSDNERNPIVIPREEVRFRVREINPVERDDAGPRRRTETEIPHFPHFPLRRTPATKCESRMRFDPATLETPAPLKIKKYDANKVETEPATHCLEATERSGEDSIRCCPIDFPEVLRRA